MTLAGLIDDKDGVETPFLAYKAFLAENLAEDDVESVWAMCAAVASREVQLHERETSSDPKTSPAGPRPRGMESGNEAARVRIGAHGKP